MLFSAKKKEKKKEINMIILHFDSLPRVNSYLLG